MDIRSYFSSARKPNITPKQDTLKEGSTPPSSKKKTRKRVLEADADDDNEAYMSDQRKKKKSIEPVAKNKRKRIIDSSDDSDHENVITKAKPSRSKDKKEIMKPSAKFFISDSSAEEISPVKKPQLRNPKPSPSKAKLKTQTKLESLTVKSKFFEETTAKDMFGDEPVKRTDKKLQDIKEKLKNFRNKKPKEEPKVEDEDAAFEAVLDQLDEVGNDWIQTEKAEEKEISEKSKKREKEPNRTKKEIGEKLSRSKRNEKNKTQLMKTAMSNTVNTKKISGENKIESQGDSLSSGYGSADSQSHIESSDSQNSLTSNTTLLKCHLTSKKKKEDTLDKESQLTCLNEKPVKTNRDRIEVDAKASTSKLPDMTISAGKEPSLTAIEDHSLWVEKWKPQSSKKIIGQQGEKSNVNKLIAWLNNWYKNNTGSKKAAFVPSGWNKDPTGACFKAALLSGPPGVGKTTSVTLVCRELGFDMVEFNASDTRSKKLLQEEVSELLKCTSLTPFFIKEGTQSAAVTKKHVLVMDEVDGMAGNEDRGGVQELIQLIKSTKVPIICMCNDRNHPKIRSLANYCFDLRFSRPRVEQIKGYMRTVCFKEKLNISSDALTDIITSANNDVRLVLNHLSMLAADKNCGLDAAKKYVKLNAWDVLRKVFSREEHKNMSIHDKCDLFFYDYSIAPLFVQENYLMVKPLCNEAKNKCKIMELFARAADCISLGDMVDLQIRSNSAWSLLPTQAIFASYAPGEILEGYCTSQINFPAWLGKNSKTGKIDRLLQEIQVHTRLKISGSKSSVNLDYAPHLKNRIMDPLVKNGTEGVHAALDMLHEYDLLKEDLESIHEVCQWPNNVNTMSSLDSKVKAAFTRAYNKNPPMRPYSLTAPIKKASGHMPEDMIEEEEIDTENEKSDNEADAMIIAKKKQPAKKNETAVASTSKGKSKTSNDSKRGRKK